ncbi:biotin-dependent carboxyltransferase family protein [Psychromonas sp.]|uniref:5-oxoprolinase subunit C family protein n=1 Tax=Psychromonas sp. TaxID=1884585 RepID=UPI0035683643
MKGDVGLRIIAPGIFSQLQDPGRYGQSKQGLSQGGVMDERAAGWANLLLKNSPNNALIEISFGLAEFEALTDLQLALTGAQMKALIVDRHLSTNIPQTNNCSFMLRKGQRLKLGFATSGARAYLAIKGGFDVPLKFASVSTVKRNFTGGLDGLGGQLKEGDLLSVFAQDSDVIQRSMSDKFIPDYDQPLTLNVIESYQADRFSTAQKAKFYATVFHVSAENDRMGMRLGGEPLDGPLAGIVSEGIALGSIQIPPDGLPIILLQDRQTLGGYPKIGCVARCDLSLLAQATVGKSIRFKPGCLAEEQLRYRRRLLFFNQF